MDVGLLSSEAYSCSVQTSDVSDVPVWHRGSVAVCAGQARRAAAIFCPDCFHLSATIAAQVIA